MFCTGSLLIKRLETFASTVTHAVEDNGPLRNPPTDFAARIVNRGVRGSLARTAFRSGVGGGQRLSWKNLCGSALAVEPLQPGLSFHAVARIVRHFHTSCSGSPGLAYSIVLHAKIARHVDAYGLGCPVKRRLALKLLWVHDMFSRLVGGIEVY